MDCFHNGAHCWRLFVSFMRLDAEWIRTATVRRKNPFGIQTHSVQPLCITLSDYLFTSLWPTNASSICIEPTYMYRPYCVDNIVLSIRFFGRYTTLWLWENSYAILMFAFDWTFVPVNRCNDGSPSVTHYQDQWSTDLNCSCEYPLERDPQGEYLYSLVS